MTRVFDPDMIAYATPSTRTCAFCGYVGTTRDVHTQFDETIPGNRFICCTCLGHPPESCWKDRFPMTEWELEREKGITDIMGEKVK